ncbi:glycosyl hydrolase, partial [Kitasatospora sp. NPDC101235]
MPTRQRRRLLLPAVTLTALGLTTTQALAAPSETPKPRPHQAQHQTEIGQKHAKKVQGTAAAGPAFTAKASSAAPGEDEGDEAENSAEGTAQYTEARTAPGVVAPGAYGAAWSQLQSMPRTGGTWDHVTDKPYNSDDPRYRDVNSNSSGGSGYVTGRITGLAADNDGYVYAGGANGGVFRSRTGGGQWQSISDKLPSLSTGTLNLDGGGRLWYATGESNTGATSYVGTGVYVLADPKRG